MKALVVGDNLVGPMQSVATVVRLDWRDCTAVCAHHTGVDPTLFTEIDICIFEVTIMTQAHYGLLAHALLQQKPVLCLYNKQPPADFTQRMQQIPADRITHQSYTHHTIQQQLIDFVFQHHSAAATQVDVLHSFDKPTQDYVAWKAAQTSQPAATLVRSWIDQLRLADPDYHRFIST